MASEILRSATNKGYSVTGVYPILSGYVLYLVGLSCLKWVCPFLNGCVLFKVGLPNDKTTRILGVPLY